MTAALILVLWLIWAGYWLAAARSVKPTLRREPGWVRLLFGAQMLATAILLFHRRWPGWLGEKVVPGGWYRYWIAVGLIVLGLALSIWARRTLAGNWSGTVTVKVGHELVQGGPYRWVRHPIYSGVLLMILGTGLAGGQIHGLLAFAVAVAGLWLRSRQEEGWMSREFGERYAAYRARSRALIPFVL